MSRFSKHMGIGDKVTIGGEEFILKPLTTDFIPDFFRAMKALSGASEGATTSELLSNVDDAGLQSIQRLIEGTLQKSFPDEPEAERKEFGMKYMSILFPAIMQINSAPPEEAKDIETIKKAKHIKNIQDGQAPSTQE